MSLIDKEKAFDSSRSSQVSDWLLSTCAALLLAFGSASAIAASHLDVTCLEKGGLASGGAREAFLDIDVVDLTTSASADLPELRETGVAPSSDATNAPHLYLGPRVATIVRDVFNGEERRPDEMLLAEESDPTPATKLSPLAESSETAVDGASDDGDLDAETAGYSPLRIHREMYRTDI
ncbi:MAG: hypothetical protein AAGA44_16410 [Pseudomonadota bacterium]